VRLASADCITDVLHRPQYLPATLPTNNAPMEDRSTVYEHISCTSAAAVELTGRRNFAVFICWRRGLWRTGCACTDQAAHLKCRNSFPPLSKCQDDLILQTYLKPFEAHKRPAYLQYYWHWNWPTLTHLLMSQEYVQKNSDLQQMWQCGCHWASNDSCMWRHRCHWASRQAQNKLTVHKTWHIFH